jgi:hypothetical protein
MTMSPHERRQPAEIDRRLSADEPRLHQALSRIAIRPRAQVVRNTSLRRSCSSTGRRTSDLLDGWGYPLAWLPPL